MGTHIDIAVFSSSSIKMKGIQIAQYVSGPQDMKVTELADPVPNPDQYTIAIHATACNFYDLLQIRGKYQHQPPLPWVSGSEFSGTIIAAPSSPSPKQGGQWKYKKGDKVFGAAQGGYAEELILSTTLSVSLIRAPSASPGMADFSLLVLQEARLRKSPPTRCCLRTFQ